MSVGNTGRARLKGGCCDEPRGIEKRAIAFLHFRVSKQASGFPISPILLAGRSPARSHDLRRLASFTGTTFIGLPRGALLVCSWRPHLGLRIWLSPAVRLAR